jgi:aconitate hydratase 2/2-methylisocitrate dehydratase
LKRSSTRTPSASTKGKVLHAGSDVRVRVNIVGSQDTTGSDDFPGTGSHGRNGDFPARRRCVSVRLSHRIGVGLKAQANTPRLMKFMHKFGLITGA